MKLYKLLMAGLFALAITACEKEEEPAPENTDSPEVVQQQISEELAKKENISVFADAFEALELDSEDIEAGITIFAPTNDAVEEATTPANGRIKRGAADSTGLTPEILKDHIVKGVIEAAGLHNGDTLITLNGKQLIVTVDGDAIRVNGVLLLEKNLAAQAKYTVHTVEKILSNTLPQNTLPTIAITVWNGAKWSPDKPKGEPEAGVTISLYNSREDYAQGNAAYTRLTEADGKVIFEDIDTAKTYYLVAEKGNMSNLFYVTESLDGGLAGMVPAAIFQSQAEIDDHADQPDAQPGNFRWSDENGDGMISEADFVAVPYKTVKAASKEIDISIGFDNNYTMGYIKNQEAALALLKSSYKRLDAWQKEFVLMDGMLSDDANCEGGSLCEIDNFQINPAHNVIYRLWSEGYGTIGQLNRLLRDVPGLSFSGQSELVAQAKGLRAYIYLQLVTYFGDIPIQAGLEFEEDIARTSSQEVYDMIAADLADVANTLPSEWPAAKRYQLNQQAARALLAKVNLINKKYEAVAELTGMIINSGAYRLMADNAAVFEDAGNAEIIWDFSFGITSSNLDYFYNNFFYGRAFCPSMRLTEIYLMHAEAKFGLEQVEAGINSLNMIRDRLGLIPVDGTYGPEELKGQLSVTWKAAMPREGNRFANLVRWETAVEVLGPNGYQPHHALLPVPQAFIDRYYILIQNPGY